jgi:hypothetical protein
MAMRVEDYNLALEYYETGIKMAPAHPSNYYWAAKIYLSTKKKVWGMIYGEIFMNLEPGSKRTDEMSAILYQVYEENISIESDTSASVSFWDNTIYINDMKDLDVTEITSMLGWYGTQYELSMTFATIGEKKVDIASLHSMRTKFVAQFYTAENAEKYPNPLFELQQKLIDSDNFEAYNYWLLNAGDANAFETWIEDHEKDFKDFAAWLSRNPLVLNETNVVHSTLY